ncbi:hypothetical protein D3218_16365 [Aureimonas flava]|uniref:Secreted protein n=1 Tax=Aureimonas flava TaxID=2320271 RepID=A0A3A1WQ36_9HYPH|nr:hypothetical protein [Aureimonas flava]RIX98757.1 hypothetical protein D3218_16365 [Aureimonas flava]
MRTIRLHLLGVLLALIGCATSMPQAPQLHRHHASAARNPVQVQMDDDDDDREDEAAILEEEAGPDRSASRERRRRA